MVVSEKCPHIHRREGWGGSCRKQTDDLVSVIVILLTFAVELSKNC